MTFRLIATKKFFVFWLSLFILLFYSGLNINGNEIYVIQIAASKTPLNVNELAKNQSISDSIKEIKASDWYRYYVGNFNSYNEASLYAKQLTKNSGLKNVYIRKLENVQEYSEKEKNSVINNQVKDSTDEKRNNDSALNEASKSNIQEIQLADTITNDTTYKNTTKTGKVSSKNNPGFTFNNFENKLTNYIPDFITRIFNSYKKEKYNFQVILLFLLIVFLFFLNIINIFLIIIYSNRTQNNIDRYNSIYKTMYENALMTYILEEESWEKTLKKLDKHDLPQNREILSSILLNLHENLKGIANEMVPDIFVKLGLHKDAMNDANSKHYHKKIAGIKKLSFLYPEGAKQIIPRLINDPDNNVSAEAQTAYIRINPENPFGFFELLNRPFTRWTQITAFYIFRLHKSEVPSFANYLNSQNTNVRNFSLQMIIFFQQLENIPMVLNMINSEAESTRFLAIKAVKDLRLYDGKSIIKKKFKKETLKNKIEIIKTFSNIGDEEDFDFLKETVLLRNVSLTLEACRSLYNMGSEGKAMLNQMNEEMKGELESYIAHISDPRN